MRRVRATGAFEATIYELFLSSLLSLLLDDNWSWWTHCRIRPPGEAVQ